MITQQQAHTFGETLGQLIDRCGGREAFGESALVTLMTNVHKALSKADFDDVFHLAGFDDSDYWWYRAHHTYPGVRLGGSVHKWAYAHYRNHARAEGKEVKEPNW